jgi:predicted MFS family arabinose efflux permease
VAAENLQTIKEELAATPPLQERGRWSWLIEKQLSRDFWFFLASSFFFDLGISLFFFLFNLFLIDVGFDEKSIGRLAGAMTIGTFAATVPVGILARKIGIRSLLLSAFIFIPIVEALRTIFLWEPTQLALAFLAGTGLSVWAVCFAPTVAKLTTEENRPFAFSLLFSMGIGVSAFGGVVGGYLPTWLHASGFSIQPTDAKRVVLLIACGIASLGAWPILKLTLSRDVSQRSPLRMPNSFMLRFLAASAVWSLVIGSFGPFANVYFARILKMPLAHIGIVFSLSQLLQVVGVLCAPLIFKKCGLVAGVMYMQITTAIFLAGLAATHTILTAAVFFLAYTGAQWMSGPGIYTFLMNKVEDSEKSNASALNLLVTSLSQAAAATGAGYLLTRFGYPAVILGIAGVAAIAALMFRLLLGGTDSATAVQAR